MDKSAFGMEEKVAGLRRASLTGVLCLAVSLWLFSCTNPSTGSGNNDSPPSTYQTLAWQNDGAGYIQYYTDDPANIQSQGYSEWHYYDPSQTPMSSVEVKAKKISGDPTMSFGVIFCVQDVSNFLTVDIDTQGYYQVGKVVAGTYVSIIPWTLAGALFSGYNVSNTITVTYDSTSSMFSLYFNKDFNPTPVATFTDPGAPLLGGRSGFIIGVSSTENFPADPVDIRFNRILPSMVP